jgi:hypothetical protein
VAGLAGGGWTHVSSPYGSPLLGTAQRQLMQKGATTRDSIQYLGFSVIAPNVKSLDQRGQLPTAFNTSKMYIESNSSDITNILAGDAKIKEFRVWCITGEGEKREGRITLHHWAQQNGMALHTAYSLAEAGPLHS